MPLIDPKQNVNLSEQLTPVTPDPFPNNPPIQALFPFSKWMPFFFGAVYGFLMRLIYKGQVLQGDWSSDVMSMSFAVFTPMAVGAITVYFAERNRRRSVAFYIVGSWVSLFFFVLGVSLIKLEGFVCIVLATPLFMILAAFGGVIMGIVCRKSKHKNTTVNSLALLPFVVALGEMGQPLPEHIQEVKQSIHINAPAEAVWHHINFPTDIKPEELKGGFAYKIGVPYPIEARTMSPTVGGKRELKWQRGVHFEEIIEAYTENQFIQWKYVFTPDSFPLGSLDDHVAIGGKYFNLENTSYRLTPEAGGTRLDISVKYRVSTGFNWYANPWAEFLITDTADAILSFYKQRSERMVIMTKNNSLYPQTTSTP